MNNEDLVYLFQNEDNELKKEDILIELYKRNRGFLFRKFIGWKQGKYVSREDEEGLFMKTIYLAAKDFDYAKGWKFLTYLEYHCINQKTLYHVSNSKEREKNTQISRILKYIDTKDITVEELVEREDYNDICKKLNISYFKNPKSLIGYLNYRNRISIDKKVTDEDGSDFYNLIIDNYRVESEIEKESTLNSIREDIKTILKIFKNTGDRISYSILKDRLYHNKKTLEQIGNEFNISRERVRQLELEILRDLRNNKYKVDLEKYLKEI